MIIKLSPEGLGANKERIGMVYNDISGDFDDSGYLRPELQKPREYSDAAGDFVISTVGWSATKTICSVFQEFDFTKTPLWYVDIKLRGAFSGAAVNNSYTLTFTNMLFDATANFNQAAIVGWENTPFSDKSII